MFVLFSTKIMKNEKEDVFGPLFFYTF